MGQFSRQLLHLGKKLADFVFSLEGATATASARRLERLRQTGGGQEEDRDAVTQATSKSMRSIDLIKCRKKDARSQLSPTSG